MWVRVPNQRTGRDGRSADKRPRTAELMGGPLDGLTIGRPLEPTAQFIILNGPPHGEPLPIHTYRYDRAAGQYHYTGSQAVARVH